jgi:hypothetical protein
MLRQAGNAVFIADMQKTQLDGVRSVICDVSDEGQVASLLQGLEAIEGRLDGLLHHSNPDDSTPHLTTARLFKAAAPLLRAGAGMAVAMGPEEVPCLTRELGRQLGPDITLRWLDSPEAGPAAASRIVTLATGLLTATV